MANLRVIKNPNFKNSREFHASLKAKGVGAKDWPNSHTEVEHLSGGKFAASIGVGHRVFFDKADGNKPKKHKLTDERPSKDYVLIQGARCCVEVYPYYAKYFDVQHEEVRLYEERWVVQRLFKVIPKEEWRDVDAYNPVIVVEEYPEPAGDVVKVTITYDTDYGILTVEYLQRDGAALKHNVTFKNTSGSAETFRVVQAWAGIAGNKCNGKDPPVDINDSALYFHGADKPQRRFNVAENLYSMIFGPGRQEKTEKCLQRPVRVEGHAQGMKADFVYGNWTLTNNEALEIDPDTATLNNPTEDGDVDDTYGRDNSDVFMIIGREEGIVYRGYVEWDVSGIGVGADVTDTVFKYHGYNNDGDCHIHEMLGARPSTSGNVAVYDEAGEGTIYADVAGFPEVGETKQIDLGAVADTDLEGQLASGWFAIGIQGDSEVGFSSYIWTEERATANPKPTLYVEYTPPPGWTGKIAGVTNPAKIMGVDVANIAKVKGVASA